MKRDILKLLTFIFFSALLICVTVFIAIIFTNNVGEDKHKAENVPEIKPPRESNLSEHAPKSENTSSKSLSPESPSTFENTQLLDGLTINVESYRENGLLFSITADDFITAYNALYSVDYGENFILPLEEWTCFSYDNSPFSSYETRYYRFQSNVRWLSEPTISFYIPADSDLVQGITFDYSMHDYTERGYELFLQECTYTLRAMLPTYGDSEITDFVTKLCEKADAPYAHVASVSFINTPPPYLYYKDTIGLFSCFVGQTIHICVVPVTPQLLDSLSVNGVETLALP